MPRIELARIGIEYEIYGDVGAQAIVVTPGGRFSLQSPGVRELAKALAEGGMRVLIWDRPNCGGSDVRFEGESESALQADTLLELVKALDLGPVALAGGSAGARVSMLAALREPEAVSHLIQWWISGGRISQMSLGAAYCCEPAIAASMRGMEAVSELPTWTEQIRRNPANRDYILSQDPAAFIATMDRWATAFVPTDASPLPGVDPADLTRLTMPVLIFRGSESDLYHPASIAAYVHERIPGSDMRDDPWPADAFARRFVEALKLGYGHFLDWPLLAPDILDFIAANERTRVA